MDQSTEATLQRKNMRIESDKMTGNGTIAHLVRKFVIIPEETDLKSISVGEREYG
jgi:hypothetical protein